VIEKARGSKFKMVSYKLVTYERNRKPRAGIVVEDKLFDAAEATGKPRYVTMLNILNNWEPAQLLLETAAVKAKDGKIQGVPLEQARLFAPVLYPSAIFCAGANYVDHLEEMNAALKMNVHPDPRSLGLDPWHFLKASRSVVGTQSFVQLPAYSKMVDWEAELAAVIGRPAKNIPMERALDYIAGYTVAVDLSARDSTLRPNVPEGSPFRYDWVAHKSFDTACPLGPWILPAKEIGDPQNLRIKLWINDVIKQDSHTSKMIFSVAEQIAYLSTRVTLHPGDLVLTGTPAGVGAARREFLKSGDVIKVWIERIGTLTNTVV
jgi:2-keto-4-pentenoate hydratase/2-oxohepta-3-ene-1,7-dioic acid hydratase in catechol pathway